MIHEIVINGKIEVDEQIDPDVEYSVFLDRIENDQGKVSKWINKDDTPVYTHKMINLGIAMLKAGEKVIMGKPKNSSMSQILRWKIEKLWDTAYSGEIKKERFYQEKMEEFMKQIDNELSKYQ